MTCAECGRENPMHWGICCRCFGHFHCIDSSVEHRGKPLPDLSGPIEWPKIPAFEFPKLPKIPGFSLKIELPVLRDILRGKFPKE